MGYIKSFSWKDFQDNCEKYKMKMMSESDLKSISNSYSNDARKLRDLLNMVGGKKLNTMGMITYFNELFVLLTNI